MKRKNGFAITSVVYSMVILFLLLLLLILIMMSSRKMIIDKQKTDLLNKFNDAPTSKNTYREAILNGAYPELYNGLIPINISSDGHITKADTSKIWYSYQNKIWANAVITFSDTEYKDDEEIPINDIKQMYVWIPRYKYQLWNVNDEEKYPNNLAGPNAINIKFEGKQATISSGELNNEWLTHPAFVSFNSNGIWVGKFEASYNEQTFTNSTLFATSNPNVDSATSASNIIIKPNVRSLISKDVSTFYTLGREVNSNLNSHMMKNTEWGAVTYLTYSIYGKCTETECEEVYLNNVNTGYYPNATASFTGQLQNSSTITGCSASSLTDAASNTCSISWNEANNKASTTGNITGIYDMSGGNWEYMMTALKSDGTKFISGRNEGSNSGFNGLYGCPTCNGYSALEKTNGIDYPTDTRYFDLYEPNVAALNNNTYYVYNKSILGDAIREVAVSKSSSGDASLWFNNITNYIAYALPWYVRGGFYNSANKAGVITSAVSSGGSNNYSFRIVLAN